MRVLALDTATEGCSVALWNAGEIIARFEEPGRGHALRILPMVDEVLAEAGIRLQALDGLAVSIGPGAFTGVRIGVSVSQGLAFGADLPVIAVSSLEALAFQGLQRPQNQRGGALACLDARMGELYWGFFEPNPARGVSAVGEPRVAKPSEVVLPDSRTYFGIGRGMRILKAMDLWSGRYDENALPHAEHIAQLGSLRLGLGEGVDPADLMPLYLRDKVALTEQERAAALR